MANFSNRGLGRIAAQDDNHIRAYSLSLPVTVARVEKTLHLPSWHKTWDQGQQGACVGFGTSMMNTILKLAESKQQIKFNPWWLWTEAKKVDGFVHTDPDDGTTVRAACDVLRAQGDEKDQATSPDLSLGIKTNRWATTVDEMRTSIANNTPVSIGVNWYSNFDQPVGKGIIRKEYWIGNGGLGDVRGGHCVCVYGASDKRQAFKIKNSWGKEYPLVWIHYSVMQRLLKEDGEATLVTDNWSPPSV